MTVTMGVEHRHPATKVLGGTLQQPVGFQGRPIRADQQHRFRTMLFYGSANPGLKGSQSSSNTNGLVFQACLARTLGVIGVATAKTTTVTDKGCIDLWVVSTTHPLQLAQASPGNRCATNTTMRADGIGLFQIPGS